MINSTIRQFNGVADTKVPLIVNSVADVMSKKRHMGSKTV